MNFKILKSFAKDLKKVKDKKLLLKVKTVTEEINETVKNIDKEEDITIKIKNTKKISNANNAYRIKVDHNYRIGAIVEHEEDEHNTVKITFSLKRFLHRKDIYNKFQKNKT